MHISELFIKFPELKTNRLHLKEIHHEESQDLLSLNNNPDVVKYINDGRTFKLKDAYESTLNYYPSLFATKKAIIWGMYLLSNNKLIGMRMCYVDSFEEPVFIQGLIQFEYRHLGYTTEAYIEIINLLRSVRVKRINAGCDSENSAAIGLLEKLGFIEHYKGFGFDFLNQAPKTIEFHKNLQLENTKTL